MKKNLQIFIIPRDIPSCRLKNRRRTMLCLLLALLCLAPVHPVAVQTKADGLISIDTEKKYKGMAASFAKGYAPTVRKNTMLLIVPFQTNLSLADDSLYVGVSFERDGNCPFLFQNYQKKVRKKGKNTYLYRCKIKLQKNRINGQYPLHLTVRAQTAAETSHKEIPSGEPSLSSGSNEKITSGEIIQQEFTIYTEITDGKKLQTTESYMDDADTSLQSGNAEENASEVASLSSNNTEEIIHQPRIILTENNLQTVSGSTNEIPSRDTSLPSGSSAFWSVTAKNCSRSQPMENVKVTLLSDTKNITFEKNAWYFEQINAEAAIDLSQNIAADRKASAETIPIQFQFDYEDKSGNPYSVTETAHLSIAAVQQAELLDLSFPESIYESDTDSLTFQVQNTGLGMIYNARVRMEGKGLFPEREMFLGNIEAGNAADGEIPVFAGTLNMDETGAVLDETAEKYGTTSAKVFFSYEDEQGTRNEQEYQLQTAIKKPQTIELTIEKEKPETNQWWITIIFFVILALALLNIWLYLRMKYYQKMRRDTYGRT